MTKVVTKTLQGSAVTQTKQGGLLIHSLVANFLWYVCQKVIREDKGGPFLRHCIINKVDAIRNQFT